MNKKAYIFDLDGVLTDTAECHYSAWKQLANEHNLAFNKAFNERLKGVSRIDSLKLILSHNKKEVDDATLQQMLTTKNNYYLEKIQQITPDDLLTGALNVLKDLKSKSKKIALGSASKNAKLVLEKLQITEFFDVIGDGHSVERSKPAPDLFIFVAEQLNVDPSDCVVIEDSQAGINAAIDANMQTIAIDVTGSLQRADKNYASMALFDEALKSLEECSS